MPTQAETPADRDARLEKLALERDQAVALLRRARTVWRLLGGLAEDTDEFLESLT